MQRVTIELSDNVWGMIVTCAGSGLYGETVDDTILALLRPGLAEAVKIGIVKL